MNRLRRKIFLVGIQQTADSSTWHPGVPVWSTMLPVTSTESVNAHVPLATAAVNDTVTIVWYATQKAKLEYTR